MLFYNPWQKYKDLLFYLAISTSTSDTVSSSSISSKNNSSAISSVTVASNVTNVSCASSITSKNRVVSEEIPDEIDPITDGDAGPSVASDDSSAPSTEVVRTYNTPAQDKLEKEIKDLHEKIDNLEKFKDSGFATEENIKQLKTSRQQLEDKRKFLKTKVSDAKRQRAQRKRKSELMISLAAENEANAAKLMPFMRDRPGRPPLEDSYPELHRAIIAIAAATAGADSKRRTDILEACHTLDDLHAALLKEGYTLSRNALYLRLVPRRSDSAEGKKHVRTVPVKIRRAKNNLRARHQDANFTFATKEYLKSVASFFGQNNTFVLSVDDKAKVPIGVTAAKYQTPLVMHMTYEIRLPDHDFVKAPKHKLIPSVYGACEIKASSTKTDPQITYSGPTYISIRSLKHDSSTAYSHGYDFEHVMEMPEFESFVKNSDGKFKPIGVLFVDGGPDENPRFPKTIDVYIQHFKKYDLDALLVSTHAPGMSAYNYVERRMAPLSRELAGLILPHETCGTHLDGKQKTIDSALEKINFRKAGEILAEIWSQIEIDSHPVVAQYVEQKDITGVPLNEMWMSLHIRTSQYLLQIVKCERTICCAPMRSNWLSMFSSRFLPAPVPVRKDEGGPTVPDASNTRSSDRFAGLWQRMALSSLTALDMPYDSYCPSVKKDITKRICNLCDAYFTSMAAVTRHRRGEGCPSVDGIHIPIPNEIREIDAIEEIDDNDITDEEEDTIPVIDLMKILTENPFIEIELSNDGEDSAKEDSEI